MQSLLEVSVSAEALSLQTKLVIYLIPVNYLGIISDPKTGKIVPSFEFQLRRRKGRLVTRFTIISESHVQIDILKHSFEAATLLPPFDFQYA
jgi:hypothetical protein